MMLLEHSFAPLGMNEVQPGTKVRGVPDVVNLRIHKPNSVEHVEQLPHTVKCGIRLGHVRESRWAEIAKVKVIGQEGRDALVVTRHHSIQVSTSKFDVAHEGTRAQARTTSHPASR